MLAAVLLVPGSPLIGLLMVLNRLTSRGPGIYRQVRVGLHGRPFVMYKLRTMRHDAESQTGPVWSHDDDPRITPFGRVLRAFHMDEFPQLWNVLKGEMALIGPRPERPEFTDFLEQEIPSYANRYAVLPGITGLSQINLPADVTLDCVRRKLVLDLEYLEKANVLLDLRIFLCTFLRLCGFRGHFTSKLLGIRRRPTIPARMELHFSPNGDEPAAAPHSRSKVTV